LGGGGHARSVAAVATAAGYHIATVIAPYISWDVPVPRYLDDLEGLQLAASSGQAVLLGVGENQVRARLFRLAQDAGAHPALVIARSATVSDADAIGAGTCVMEHAHVGPGSEVGAGCILNTAAVVEHDSRIGRFAHIAPRATLGGGCEIGEFSLVGAGVVLLPGIRVGRGSVVAAGAVVTHDIPDGVVAVGVPARWRE
jgi:UDP-perosamine 4-acetyltransferase